MNNDRTKQQKEEDISVQEVEAVPIDPSEEVGYDYDTRNINNSGNDNQRSEQTERHSPFGQRTASYYNANSSSCCSGCSVILMGLLFLFFIVGSKGFVVFAVALFCVLFIILQILRVTVVKRPGR